MSFRKKFNRPVTVVRKKTKSLDRSPHLYKQDALFSSLKRGSGSANLVVRLLAEKEEGLEVAPLSDSGPLRAAKGFLVRQRENPLDQSKAPVADLEEGESLLKGDILDLQDFRLYEDSSGSYRAATLMATVEEIENNEMEILDRSLISVRTNIAMSEG